MTEEDQDTLLFDDYFSDPGDKGVELMLHYKGKDLKFRVRRSITLGERQVASNAAIKIELDQDGKPILKDMNQSAYTTEVLLAAVKEWPFTYKGGGKVPINRKTVSALDSDLADKLGLMILQGDVRQNEAIAPFEKESVEV